MWTMHDSAMFAWHAAGAGKARRSPTDTVDSTTALGMKNVKNVKETIARKRNAWAPMLTVLDDMHVLLHDSIYRFEPGYPASPAPFRLRNHRCLLHHDLPSQLWPSFPPSATRSTILRTKVASASEKISFPVPTAEVLTSNNPSAVDVKAVATRSAFATLEPFVGKVSTAALAEPFAQHFNINFDTAINETMAVGEQVAATTRQPSTLKP